MNTFTIYATKLGVLFDLIDCLCLKNGSVNILATSQDGLYKDETMPCVSILTGLEFEKLEQQVETARMDMKKPEVQIHICEEPDWDCGS